MHPLDPLTPEEISRSATIARPDFGQHQPNFRVITLQEPPKHQLAPFLDRERQGKPPGPAPTRHARVEVTLPSPDGGGGVFELLVDLDRNRVAKKQHVPGKHSYIDSGYMKQVEAACLANDEVQRHIRTLDLPRGATVVVEAWAYATDGQNDMSKRVTMVSRRFSKVTSWTMLTFRNSAGSTSGCSKTAMQTITLILWTCAPRCRSSFR